MLIGRLSQMSPPPCLHDTVIQSYVQLKSSFYGVGRPMNGATLGRSCPPGVQLLPHFDVWSYRACQPLQMWQISNFCEIHSLSYEASKFFAMLSLCVFFGRYFAPGANIVPPIAYKSHSTPFPIRPHVLTPHSWLCDKNCGRSSAPKKSGIWKWRITLMLPCHIWQAPLTRLYISRRKCEMVLAVAKNTTRLVARVFWVVARVLLGGC